MDQGLKYISRDRSCKEFSIEFSCVNLIQGSSPKPTLRFLSCNKYLHIYCNYQQDNWPELLPLTEFAYNNTLRTIISVSPFFTNKGYHLNITVHPKCDIASSRAYDFTIDLNELQSNLKAEISVA